MNTSRKTTSFVGAFFLISNVTFILGAVVLIEPLLNAPDYLNMISTNGAQVNLGVLLELINGIAYLGIAVLMFPIFKKQYESMALGYVSFRILEFVMQFLSSISLLTLLTLSDDFVAAGAAQADHYQVVGELLLTSRYWGFQMVSITFGLGALIFYYVLYQMKLIPRFISVWGFLGAVLVLANLLFDMFGVNLGALGNLGIVMLLNELFLGVWLIVKGFNPDAIASEAT